MTDISASYRPSHGDNVTVEGRERTNETPGILSVFGPKSVGVQLQLDKVYMNE